MLLLLVAIAIGWAVIRRQFTLIKRAIQQYSGLKPEDQEQKGPYQDMAEEKEENVESEKEEKQASDNQFVQKKVGEKTRGSIDIGE